MRREAGMNPQYPATSNMGARVMDPFERAM
jgi:hypothetical protein